VSPKVEVALEVGSKRTFATALDWPGWCRSGRDEAGALDALLAYAPRYAAVLGAHVQGFEHLDPRASYVFMSNHRSNFDVLARAWDGKRRAWPGRLN